MIFKYKDISPVVSPTAFVAPTATVLGDVVIGDGSSVWFGAVVRGDIDSIRIGAHSSIQDNVVVHVTGGIYPTTIGDNVIVGHGAILHGCTIGDAVLIGMGATILDNAVIGNNTIVAAGALVREGQQIPENVLVAGVPAEVKRPVSKLDIANHRRILKNYRKETADYLAGIATPIF